jgi:hypothetical protein
VSPYFVKEIVELPNVALLAGNQKDELIGLRFLKELYCTDDGP